MTPNRAEEKDWQTRIKTVPIEPPKGEGVHRGNTHRQPLNQRT